MPLTEADQRRVDEAEAEAEAAGSSRLLVRVPPDSQKLGSITVMCLILNRTIGSGIYVTPALVLKATNSIGVSLFLWTLGAVFGICGVLVWLELGLSIPKFRPSDHEFESNVDGEGPLESVPRNGGEKNYLEYIYTHPSFLTTCLYGLTFIVLGNLSGNAIAFGIYIVQAAGITNQPSAVRALAVAALTFACLLHGLWRKGGIILNNVLAFIKVITLLAIIGIGFAAGAGASLGTGPIGRAAVKQNMSIHTSFADARGNVADYSASILFIVYSFSGFKQPFYMLSEVAEPKKRFAKTAIGTMVLVAILFVLANVAYFCAITKDQILASKLDMASVFFEELFGNETAPRVMAGIIAFSILGNIIVMTFTASRVKQEIAKEGILPFSLFFAKGTVTPYARLKARYFPFKGNQIPEQSPAAALFLHWVFAVILVAATSSRSPTVAYTVLVELYAYTLVAMVGFFVATGVIYLRLNKRKEWTKSLGFSPWGGPTAAIIYATICAFLVVTLFLTPSTATPFAFSRTGVQPYVVPTVGLGTLLIGYIYYIVFAKLIPRWRKQVLVVEREPILVRQGGRPDGEWVQLLEVVEFWWAARQPGAKDA